MKYAESLVNFIAAYGTHSLVAGLDTDGPGPDFAGSVNSRRTAAESIVNGSPLPAGATIDGLAPTGPDGIELDDPDTTGDESADNLDAPADSYDFLWSQGTWATILMAAPRPVSIVIDLWMGGLAERTAPFGGMLGTTFNYIFEIQLENLQNADRFYYLERLDGLNLLPQLEANSFAEIVMRNTSATGLRRRHLLEARLRHRISTPRHERAPFPTTRTTGLQRERASSSVFRTARSASTAASTSSGTASANPVDRVKTDHLERGRRHPARQRRQRHTSKAAPATTTRSAAMGDDIDTDIFGDDVMKGGPGNDAIFGGPGFDLLQGNADDDYIIAGNDTSEVFGGEGDDVIFSGEGGLESFAGAGDDWMEAGPQLDLLVGDENNQFQDDPNSGHDVLIGGKGDDDYDSEGGDDIMVGDVLGTERFEGMLGFDLATYRSILSRSTPT